MKTKELGIEDTCFCGTKVKCGMKGDKLQWQVNGKAHYNYDTNTKKTTCNAEQPTETAPTEPLIDEVKWSKNPIDLANIDMPHETKQKILGVVKDANKILKVIEWQVWEDLGFNTSPARVGMYVYNIAKKLLYVPMVYDSKHQEGEGAIPDDTSS